MHTVPEITSLAAFTHAQPSGNVAPGADARTRKKTHIYGTKEKKMRLTCTVVIKSNLKRIFFLFVFFEKDTERVSGTRAHTSVKHQNMNRGESVLFIFFLLIALNMLISLLSFWGAL